MTEVFKAASGIIISDILALLRFAGVAIAFIVVSIITVGGSAALFYPLDCAIATRKAHGRGSWSTEPAFAFLGFMMGFITLTILMEQHKISEAGATWTGVKRLTTAASSTLVINGTIGLTPWAIVKIYTWSEDAAKRWRAGAEQVELTQIQASIPSQLERTFGAEGGEGESIIDKSGLLQ